MVIWEGDDQCELRDIRAARDVITAQLHGLKGQESLPGEQKGNTFSANQKHVPSHNGSLQCANAQRLKLVSKKATITHVGVQPAQRKDHVTRVVAHNLDGGNTRQRPDDARRAPGLDRQHGTVGGAETQPEVRPGVALARLETNQ